MPTRCEQCAPAKHGQPASRRTIGKPFADCEQCGTTFARLHCTEWSLLGAAERTRIVGGTLLSAGLLGSLPGVVALGWSVAGPARLEPWQLALTFAAGLLLAGVWKGTRLAHAIKRSRSRMSDPMYCARLVEFELDHRAAWTRG